VIDATELPLVPPDDTELLELLLEELIEALLVLLEELLDALLELDEAVDELWFDDGSVVADIIAAAPMPPIPVGDTSKS
jgi:hypothetical protein